MMIYRFLPEEFALQVLQTGMWKVGRLFGLNDPADFQPRLICEPPRSNAGADADEAFAQIFLRHLHENLGVVCLSSAIRDPAVWGHYADDHRGMALGFDFTPNGIRLHEVRYQEERATISYQETEALSSDGKPHAEFIERVITSGFTSKAPSWRYEQEFRIFVPFVRPHCQMIGSHYFQHIGAPNRVVLGLRCKTPESDICRLGQARGLNFAQITTARMDPVNHSLHVSFPIHVQPSAVAPP